MSNKRFIVARLQNTTVQIFDKFKSGRKTQPLRHADQKVNVIYW